MTTPNDDQLCKWLRSQKDSGLPRMGGGTVSYEPGKSTSWISPPVMVALNPDGALAASRIEALIAERDAARAKIERLRRDLADIGILAEMRIKDGNDMGASVWRIALEDIAKEARAALKETNDDA